MDTVLFMLHHKSVCL